MFSICSLKVDITLLVYLGQDFGHLMLMVLLVEHYYSAPGCIIFELDLLRPFVVFSKEALRSTQLDFAQLRLGCGMRLKVSFIFSIVCPTAPLFTSIYFQSHVRVL